MTSNKNKNGNNSIQINGDGDIKNNTVQILNNKPPTKTEMYTLLTIFYDSSSKEMDKYEFDPPANVLRKLRYNDADKYKKIFFLYQVNMKKFEDVIDRFNDSQIIVKKLGRLFLDSSDICSDGNSQLDYVDKMVKKFIKSDDRFNVSEEKLGYFSILLLYYGVYKCKVLKNPNIQQK